jgi:hypothetical protein
MLTAVVKYYVTACRTEVRRVLIQMIIAILRWQKVVSIEFTKRKTSFKKAIALKPLFAIANPNNLIKNKVTETGGKP